MQHQAGHHEGGYLEGVRVLDFTQYLAGPACTRLLAEMGADVIKVEVAPSGDPTRKGVPRRNGRAGVFIQQNRGKRSLCVDLRRPEGVELVRQLIPRVDVVVENYSPGVMARRGLGYDTLSELNPGLIMASISGFGQTGPYADRTCFDFIAQAMSGMMHMTGEPDGPPTFVGVGVGDVNAGVHAFAAIGHALFRRERTGKGTHIDVSMVDALFHMQEYAVHAPSMSEDIVPHRQGRHYQPVAPAGTYKAPEGWIVILCTDNQVDGLWAAMGHPEYAQDPRFCDNNVRLENRAELTELIEAWMASLPSDEAVLATLAAHRVPAGPVLSPAEAADHPYFQGRDMVRQISDPLAGDLAIPGFPIKFADAPPDVDLATAALGQHNREVLADLAGLDEEAVAALEAEGILASKDR